jgi:hypothetical protein
MALLRNIARGLRSQFRKERVEGELDEEMNDFLAMAAEEKMKQGMSRKKALRAVPYSSMSSNVWPSTPAAPRFALQQS